MVFYRGYLLLLVFVAYAEFAHAQRIPTQITYGLCTIDVVENVLSMDFNLDVQSDPRGALHVFQDTDDQDCPITPTNSGYSLSVKIDMRNKKEIEPKKGCNFFYDGTAEEYSLRLHYFEFPDRTDLDYGLNRIYTMICNETTTTHLVKEAKIYSRVPDLNEDVVPYVPDVKLEVLRENPVGTGVYEVVDANTVIETQTRLRLRLTFTYGTYDLYKVSSVAGLLTYISPTPGLDNRFEFLNAQGCPSNPLAPPTGFVAAQPSGPGEFVTQTDDFAAFAWDIIDSSYIFFWTYIRFCGGQPYSDDRCNNPCVNNFRKRRDVGEKGDDDVKYVMARIKVITKGADHDASKSDDNATALWGAIGACIGIGVLLCVLLCVALIVVAGRRRRRRRAEKAGPPHVFANEVIANEVKVPY